MAGWRRAVDLAMTAEEIETLTAESGPLGSVRGALSNGRPRSMETLTYSPRSTVESNVDGN
jgi:hypothetical protein